MQTVAISRKKGGRSPKPGVRRYPGGQIHHADRAPRETEEQARATAEEARVRILLGVKEWQERRSTGTLKEARLKMSDPLLGSALGRLLFLFLRAKKPEDGITKHQFSAGGYFSWLYRSYAKVKGIPSPNVKAIDYGANVKGLSIHPEDTDEWVSDVKDKWQAMYGAIIEADQREGKVFTALVRVLIEDLDPEPGQIGALRIGLNAINRARGV